MALPSEEFEVSALIDYGSSVLGPQHAHLDKMVNFRDEIASARTFSFLRELEPLLDAGLIKGGDLNNAIVYVDQDIAPSTLDKLKTAFGRDDVRGYTARYIKQYQPSVFKRGCPTQTLRRCR